MKLEEKIIALRKSKNWSQEELAYQLDVSRQAVSKWESGESTPSIDKIVMMSSIFSVSTDYLLKDNENNEISTNEISAKTMNKDEVKVYLSTNKKDSFNIALATLLCIVSPTILLVLLALNKYDETSIKESYVYAIGLVVLFVVIMSAVLIYVYTGLRMSRYSFLETENILIKEDVKNEIRTLKENYRAKFTKGIILGVALLIISPIPLILAGVLSAPSYLLIGLVPVLLILIAVSVFTFINVSMKNYAFDKLLQEGDYTITKKERSKTNEAFSTIYWLLITATYLLTSFLTNRWDLTWLIFLIGGLVYAAIETFIETRKKK